MLDCAGAYFSEVSCSHGVYLEAIWDHSEDHKAIQTHLEVIFTVKLHFFAGHFDAWEPPGTTLK